MDQVVELERREWKERLEEGKEKQIKLMFSLLPTCPSPIHSSLISHTFFFFFFGNRERKGRRVRERNTNEREEHWLVAFHTCPHRGLNLQPRHVPWLGIKFTTFQFVGWHPTEPYQSHWTFKMQIKSYHSLVWVPPIVSHLGRNSL